VGKVVIIPARPDPRAEIRHNPRGQSKQVPISGDPYIEGQRLLVEAIKYLVREDPTGNREAVGILSEHFRTQFRMSDRPLSH
jgi:hypothetical protein